jgi:uncharacterized protein YbcC (UPF0753/DUF2309 family)
MIQTHTGFDEHAVLHNLVHYLPAQNPLKDFVHHNTLHAFQQDTFHKALINASSLFGYKTYLSLDAFRTKYFNSEINENILDAILIKEKGNTNLGLWKQKLLYEVFDESVQGKVGNLRANWKKEYAINLEKSTHSLLFRVLCSYLDQGIALWTFPENKEGFLAAISNLEINSAIGIFSSKRAKELLLSKASITELLEILVGDAALFEYYLFDQQFAHPGWSGMVATLEQNPTSLLDSKPITFKELVIFELLLEIDTLDQKFNSNWSPLGLKVRANEYHLFEKNTENELFEVYKLWQEAFEWSFYDQVLSNSKATLAVEKTKFPNFQGLFCMDDR